MRITHYGFIYQHPTEIITGCVTPVLVVAVLAVIVGAVVNGILKDFNRALKKKDFERAKQDYKKVNIPVILTYIIGFVVGTAAVNLIEGLTGKIELDFVILFIMILQGAAVSMMCYSVTIYKVKTVRMAEMMKKAGMKDINVNLNGTLHICVLACIFFSIMNFITVPIGLLKNPTEHPMGRFLIYCLCCGFMSDPLCMICYRMLVSSIQKFDDSRKKHIAEETQNLAVSAKESAATGQDQSAAVKEIVATVEDNNNLSKSIGEKVNNVSKLAEKSKDDVATGIEFLERNVKDLQEILESNKQTIDGIKSLGEKIDNIWEIVTLINDVAADAKIIAFNAELEASAAGEAGKNFHIVATEVRRLSDNIIDSTHDIKDRIEEVQKSSNELILSGERGSQKVQSGYEDAKKLESRFGSIKDSSEETANSSKEINDFIKQMTASSEQMLTAMKQIAAGIENFSQSTENISHSSEVLKNIAAEM